MSNKDNEFISAKDLSWEGILREVKKSKSALQPVFEAFTNSLEAIKIRKEHNSEISGKISIDIYSTKTADSKNHIFEKLTISDNGIGFNEEEFERFNTYKLSDKGFNNHGSGRVQFVHHFVVTRIKSIYKNNDKKLYERRFIVSKEENFLKKNAIVKHIQNKRISNAEIGTELEFSNLRYSSHTYNQLDHQLLKDQLIERYIHYFCNKIDQIPKIEINHYLQGEKAGKSTISKIDIPTPDKNLSIHIKYSKISNDGKEIIKTGNGEDFNLLSFRISKDILKANQLKLVSKGEVAPKSLINLKCLSEEDIVHQDRFLFLVSSKFIDDHDSDIRGEINIPSKDDFKSQDAFIPESILLEDIEDSVNNKIIENYDEISRTKEDHISNYEKLKKMFLLDDELLDEISISVTDSESKILEKFYSAEAKKEANIDASIKKSFDSIENLDTTSDSYEYDLEVEINKLVKEIPLQNRLTLTQYVARRKLILELFDKILKRKLSIQNENRNIDEKLIHNLLFQQGSDNPDRSDLWILSEEFIYFKGSSETPLSKVELNGQKLFKDEFTKEEERYLKSLGEDRVLKRPDVLLFPEEGKCLIIEFKSPVVNASDHLTQIDKYANLIRNYTIEEIQITTFYGYLLGEAIEPRDVLGAVSRYEHSKQFDYLFRPSEIVHGFDGRDNGSIYNEVIKYSTLLERATQRNKIFLDKLKSIPVDIDV